MVYHQLTPPQWTISNITDISISLYTGSKDVLANPTDVLRLISDLQQNDKSMITRVHNEPEYGHLDFTWGVDCKEKIYPLVVEDLDTAFGKKVVGKKEEHKDVERKDVELMESKVEKEVDVVYI